MNKTKLAAALFNKFAQQYQDKYMDLSKYTEGLNDFCDRIQSPSAHILDIACGPGNITSYIKNKHANWNILGIDLAPKMIELASLNNPDSEFKVWDAKNINQLNVSFDGIICGFGLPYLSKNEALQMLSDASRMLLPRGILYISTMEGDYSKSEWKGPSTGESDKLFTYYHEADYLINAIRDYGLSVEYMSRVVSKEGEITITDLIIIAQN